MLIMWNYYLVFLNRILSKIRIIYESIDFKKILSFLGSLPHIT
ncbi:hypothetical protein CLOSBL3_10923 [Clostridiaceae bacterium BL-3]|nr:hypothetical protein CLOSBL3_10923 [Clostridiaceae bacterium BL-3]